MTCDVQAAGTIELYFYGELSPAARTEVQEHLRQCRECRRALEDLSVIRAALGSRPDIAAPPGGDWSAFMAKLDLSVRQLGRGSTGPVRGPARLTAAPLSTRLVPYLAMAALLAIVTVSVLLVIQRRDDGVAEPAGNTRVVSERPGPSTPGPASASLDPASLDPALMSLTGQHFERSKLVVLGLATRDASKPSQGGWQFERALATTLLGDTRLYRRAAEERGMNTIAGVMRDLELVLLQTSMSDEPDAESLEQLQRLIRRRDLLTKMNAVYTSGP
jgi:Putative zinc-finger